MLSWFKRLKDEQEPSPSWYRKGVRGVVLSIVVFAALGFILLSFYAMEMTTVVNGVVRPTETFKVKPGISGIIKEVKALTTDRVKAGDLVALLDDTEIRAEIEKAKKDLQLNLALGLVRLLKGMKKRSSGG